MKCKSLNKFIRRDTFIKRVRTYMRNNRTVINNNNIDFSEVQNSSNPIDNLEKTTTTFTPINNIEKESEIGKREFFLPEREEVKLFCIKDERRSWAIKHKVTHVALNDLLMILNQCKIHGIPKNARTLLETPIKNICREVTPGEYCHFGLSDTLKKILDSSILSIPSKLLLNFNVDGLPISKSSKEQFWPILCSIQNMNIRPFAIGV